MSDFDWPDVLYFQAKFGWERVKASEDILNYSQLSRLILISHLGVLVRFDSKILMSISFPLFTIILSQRSDLLLKHQRFTRR